MAKMIALTAQPTTQSLKKAHQAFHLLTKFKGAKSLFLIAAMFVCGTILALAFHIPVKDVMSGYSYDVLVIMIVMELFTNSITETGIMQKIAVQLARLAKGKKRLCLILFGSMMFIISSCLNNITAVLMILPTIFVLMRTLDVNRRYVCTFFAALLALSNTGGASTPIGDFPAILIMSSGITSFGSYLVHSFPLLALTSAVLLLVWGSQVPKEKDDGAVRRLAIANLQSQYKNVRVHYDVLKWLILVFIGMFLSWILVPQDMIPPEIIAMLGYVIATVICSVKGLKIEQKMDLRSVLTIASFLFVAAVVGQTGLLELLAAFLYAHIHNPKLLVLALMLITSVVSGIFSAGPATAAMMPVIIELCNGPLRTQADWVAVAYAAAICSGSSAFIWSASAGLILSGKVNDAAITEVNGKSISWGVGHYLKYGILNYLIQISIALGSMLLIL